MVADHLGCSVDVVTYMDKACSGQNHCEYLVDQERYQIKPCPSGMASRLSYLEVSYECIKGMLCFFVANQIRYVLRTWHSVLTYEQFV